LSNYSHLNIYSIDREELFKQRGDLIDFIMNPNGSEFNPEEFEQFNYSNPIRIAIPDLESCDVIDTTEDNTKKTIEPETFSALSPTDWAMYGVAGLSGLLALDFLANKLKGRNRKKEEDDLGKWDTAEIFEKQFESEDLNALAAGLNGDSEE